MVKMVSAPAEWPILSLFLEEFERSKTFFSSIKVVLIPRSQNTKTDKFALGVRILSSETFYVNSWHPTWITEPF